MFGINTCKISRYISSYRTLTSEVMWGHWRSKPTFLFFHRNVHFSILLCFCQLVPMGPSMKLMYLLNRGLELYFGFPFVSIKQFLRNLLGVRLGGSKRSKRGQSTQNWKMYLYIYAFFGTDTQLILLIMLNIDFDLFFTF